MRNISFGERSPGVDLLDLRNQLLGRFCGGNGFDNYCHVITPELGFFPKEQSTMGDTSEIVCKVCVYDFWVPRKCVSSTAVIAFFGMNTLLGVRSVGASCN